MNIIEGSSGAKKGVSIMPQSGSCMLFITGALLSKCCSSLIIKLLKAFYKNYQSQSQSLSSFFSHPTIFLYTIN